MESSWDDRESPKSLASEGKLSKIPLISTSDIHSALASKYSFSSCYAADILEYLLEMTNSNKFGVAISNATRAD